MKKSSFVLNVLMAALIVVGSAGLGRAGDLKVNAFVDILYFLSNDQPTVDGGLTGKNLVEGQFVAKGELDVEKETGGVTFRIDLDFPSNETSDAVCLDVDGDGTGELDLDEDGACVKGTLGTTLANTNMSVSGLPGGPNTFAEHIEQAKFVWAVPGLPVDLNLTGGVFNSPIGYESQDAPDRSFVTYGQLFGLVPSNLAGIELAANHGPISGSIIYVDQWRPEGNVLANGDQPVNVGLPTSEENSIGFTLGFSPMPIVGISVGYLTSEVNPPTGTKQAGDLLDIIVSGSVMPSSHLDLNYAVEYFTDDLVDAAFALTVGATHGKHSLSVRYDSVDNSDPVGGKSADPTSLTLSASCGLADTLTARLEYVTYDGDDKGASDADMILLQFVATLN